MLARRRAGARRPTSASTSACVALDLDEANEMVEKHAAAHSLIATLDDILVPALGLVGADRRKGALEPARERFIFDAMRRVAEDLGRARHADDAGWGRHAASSRRTMKPTALAALILARAVPAQVTDIDAKGRQPRHRRLGGASRRPRATPRTRRRRLRSKYPDAADHRRLWAAEGDLARPRERLAHLGVDAPWSRGSPTPSRKCKKDPTRITANGRSRSFGWDSAARRS